MKNILLAFFMLIMFGLPVSAQLPDGSIAPDWTVTDLNGNTHNLYSILNSGRHVVLDFSATWCGPCWNYHNTHRLTDLYNQFGPPGTNEIMVFFFEAENNNNTACLYGPTGCVGPNGGTQGNWVAGTPYPIVDLSAIGQNAIKTAYQISYFPTFYAINANDKRIWEVGQPTLLGWQNWLFQSFDMAMNPAIQQPLCNNNGSVNLNVTGGYSNKTYQWSNGATTPTLTNASPGTYTCKVTDFNGYFLNSPQFVLAGPPPINVNLTSQTNVTCGGGNNGALSVSASGGSGTLSYSWSNGMNGSSISNIPAGTYTVSVTDANNCVKTNQYTITQPAPLTVVPQITHATCSQTNGSVLLIEQGGSYPYNYILNGVSQPSPIFDNLGAGTYNYSVIDNNNCSTSSSVTVTTTTAPSALASTNANITCLVPTGTVSGTGSTTGNFISYLWTTSNGNILSGANSLTATVSEGGVYTLKVTNNGNGCTATSNVTVPSNITPPTVAIQSPDQLNCNVSNVTVNASGSSSGPNFVYNWTTQNGNIVSGGNSPTPVVNQPGSYSLQVTNNTNGCTAVSAVTVAQDITPPTVTVQSEATLTCGEPTAQICATTSSGSLVWNVDGANGNCATFNEPGVYTLTATGANGCTAGASTTISISNDFPQVSVAEPEVLTCLVNNVELTGTVNGDPSAFTYVWSDQSGVIVGDDINTTVSEPGLYNLQVTNNANGCQASSSVEVDEVTVAPASEFNSNLESGTVTASVASPDEMASYAWTVNGTDSGTGTSFEFTLPGPGTYNICLESTNDCGTNTSCEEYFVAAPLIVEVVGTDVVCFGQNNGTITATATGGVQPYTYAWTGPNGFTSTNQVISDLAPGTYTVAITDNNGNTVTSEYTVAEPPALTEGDVTIVNDQDNSNSGSVQVIVHGGRGVLSYAWSNGQNTSKLSGVGAGEYFCSVTDENGCIKVFGPYIVENVSGINESEFITKLEVYPNPASSLVNISLGLVKQSNVEISVVNALGRKMTSERYSGNTDTVINVSQMPGGIYFVQVRNQDFTIMRKFQIVR